MAEKEYSVLREEAIEAFGFIYKDTLAFDMVLADKSERTRLLQDNIYLSRTKAKRAYLYKEQLTEINKLIEGDFRSEKDSSATKIRAIEMKNKLLFQDMMIDADESNALNVAFVSMTREDFESTDTIEVHSGSGESFVDLSDMRAEEDEETPEEKLKRMVEEKQCKTDTTKK